MKTWIFTIELVAFWAARVLEVSNAASLTWPVWMSKRRNSASYDLIDPTVTKAKVPWTTSPMKNTKSSDSMKVHNLLRSCRALQRSGTRKIIITRLRKPALKTLSPFPSSHLSALLFPPRRRHWSPVSSSSTWNSSWRFFFFFLYWALEYLTFFFLKRDTNPTCSARHLRFPKHNTRAAVRVAGSVCRRIHNSRFPFA